MEKIVVRASKEYEIRIGSGLLSETGSAVREISGCETAMLVSDSRVYPLYGGTVRESLEKQGIRVVTFVFESGEKQKNVETFTALLERMSEERMTRGDIVIALGGGVTGDLAGFAAAVYRRGIPVVQVPTSVLAAVDSSVGGKTGVDLRSGKNQVGAFYQPALVLCDPDVFRTLPEDEFRNGVAEIIKYAMIGSEKMFRGILETPVSEQYEKVVSKCVSMKRDIVERDEFERGDRMLLNFGHTVGHAVELRSGYSLPHGRAVAIGMSVVTRAAAAKGDCEESVRDGLITLLEKYGLPTETSFSAADLYDAAMADKKIGAGTLPLIVPRGIGKAEIRKIRKEEFLDWLYAGGIR